VLGGLVVVLLAGDPGRTGRQKTWLRVITGIAIAFLTRGQPDRCDRRSVTGQSQFPDGHCHSGKIISADRPRRPVGGMRVSPDGAPWALRGPGPAQVR
jgi:hypothetical protein